MSVNTIQGFYDAENASGYSPTLPKVTQAIYNRSLLERAKPLLVYQKFGGRTPLKQRNGKSMVFRRWLNLDENTTPLSEGTTPAGSNLTKEEVVATIKQYGDYVTISDMMDMTNFDPTINEASEILGEQMGQSLDTIYADLLAAGTNAYVVSATSTPPAAFDDNRSTVAQIINKVALDKAINVLDRNNAKKFTRLIEGADRDNTYPVAPAYWAVIHPDITRDLYDATSSGLNIGSNFTPVEHYAKQTQVMPGEVGKYRSIRFIESTHCKVWPDSGSGTTTGMRTTSGSNCDVYGVMIFGRDAYKIVPLEKGSARTIVHRAGGPGDPLDQRNTVGWKAATTLAITNDDWMVRLEVTASA